MNNVEFKNLVDYYLKQLKDGNDDAMNYIYELTHKQLYALCYSYFKNREDSEDALFEAYLKMKTEILKFNGHSGFAWVYTIVKNICLNKLKKNKNVDLLDDNLVDETTSTTQNDKGAIILDIAKSILTEHELRVLILHAVEGYKFKDIAKITNKLEATVRWQYNNVIKKVKKEYEDLYEKK